MGVPAFFRWLSRKYTSLIVHCVEEKPKEIDGETIPVDTSQPNPNDVEFDNLYLDMNGIIHPCCHPEDRPAPKNEDEMMVLIFEFVDRIFSIVRPRRVLYMAIDGVAPRAKMNQQRSRRFRASKETVEKIKDMARIREQVLSNGMYLPPEKPKEEHFDSNCITPGTPFMFKLAECLRYYVHERLNNDPGWKDIKVILSDANVPGEGEHKIMDYIRRQKAQPDHDPNTHHCLCGADADLIMLGLATHEVNFTIIREEFKPNEPKPCELCGLKGHEMKDCEGLTAEESTENIEMPGAAQEYIFVRLNVLREYLQTELQMPNLPFDYDFERALDDWVFMCFFVGNDFLPHLPSLEIREGAIDRLVKLYKNTVYKTGGYLTDSGVVNLSRVQLIMSDLGQVEDEIFKTRRQKDLHFRNREKQNKRRMKAQQNAQRPKWMMGGQFAPQPVGNKRQGLGYSGGFGGVGAVQNPRQAAYESRKQNMEASANRGGEQGEQRGRKRPAEDQGGRDKDDSDDDEPADNVKLWEDGFKDRYYQNKFDVGPDDISFRHNVANHYVRGLCWVLRYYYQGCASWKWYFPYHYAPFASDFINIGDLPNDFEKNTEPFKPLEQLMGVFPAASKKHLPLTWQTLMYDPESPIIDFYPTDFKIDLNGKKYAWQGVALLPFVEETRLRKALKSVYPDLTPQEKKRNCRGTDVLFVGSKHPVYEFLEGLYEGQGQDTPVPVDPKLTKGMGGNVWCTSNNFEKGGIVPAPVPGVEDIHDNRCITVAFEDPRYEPNFIFKAMLLPGAIMPAPTLKPDNFHGKNPGRQWRPQLGFKPHSGYRDNKNVAPSLRMMSNALGMNTRPGLMGAAPSLGGGGGSGGSSSLGLMGAAPNRGLGAPNRGLASLNRGGDGLMGAAPGLGGFLSNFLQQQQQQQQQQGRNDGKYRQRDRQDRWGHGSQGNQRNYGNQGSQRNQGSHGNQRSQGGHYNQRNQDNQGNQHWSGQNYDYDNGGQNNSSRNHSRQQQQGNRQQQQGNRQQQQSNRQQQGNRQQQSHDDMNQDSAYQYQSYYQDYSDTHSGGSGSSSSGGGGGGGRSGQQRNDWSQSGERYRPY